MDANDQVFFDVFMDGMEKTARERKEYDWEHEGRLKKSWGRLGSVGGTVAGAGIGAGMGKGKWRALTALLGAGAGGLGGHVIGRMAASNAHKTMKAVEDGRANPKRKTVDRWY